MKRRSGEGGIAMIVVLLMMLLVSTLLVGFTASVMSDQHFRFIDREHIQAFYAAHAGLEKLTTDLGNMFQTNFAPKAADINAVFATPPSMPGIAFTAAGGVAGSGYTVTFTPDVNGNPLASNTNVSSGPYQGLIALLTPYTLNVTAQTGLGGEVHLTRSMETVAIPVFQFGMFSSTDLSFFSGSNFAFGGRVATNGNLFLAEGDGNVPGLTLSSNVTAALNVIRMGLSNGTPLTLAPTHGGPVIVPTAPAASRALATNEGSLVGLVGSAANPNWTTLSLTTYNGYIRNGLTGAHALTLPVVAAGGANADITRRPCSPLTPSIVGQPQAACTENVTNPVLFGERYFSKVSLRILLSDTAADITNLPTTVTATPPVLLDGNWNTAVPNNGTAYGPIGVLNPPIATSPGVTTATTNANTPNAPITQISVAAIPAGFQIPATMTTTNGANVNAAVICTGRTATTFFGCSGFTKAIAAGAGTTVSGSVASGNGTITVSTITTAGQLAIAVAATNKTLIVTRTAAFAPTTFWLPSTAQPGGQVVSCSGYSTTAAPINTFTGCLNVPASNFPKTITTNALSNAGTGTIGGYIKVEMQNNAGVWSDVTMEMLNWGIGGPNLGDPANGGLICPDPNSKAILRMQRLKDNSGLSDPVSAGTCDYTPEVTGANNSNDYWPNVLFDPREGTTRGTAPAVATNVVLGGVMYYIALDVGNLSKWFAGVAPYAAGTGINALNSNGYAVYFSDRRNNDFIQPGGAPSLETGDYGFEDIINPLDVNGVPNGVLDAGEDVNFNGVLDLYGGIPTYTLGAARATVASAPPGNSIPLTAAATPLTQLTPAQAQVNRPILFRRALKLMDGGLGKILNGLTIVTENPVYVQGSWNMGAAAPAAGDGHVATSIIADGVTLLTDNWNDDTMFQNPYTPASRPRSANTYYRVAIIGGKNISFPWSPGPQAWAASGDFGTDGGAHNFLRMLEGNGQTMTYLGSIATFYYSRQATGIYKGGSAAIYDPPTRAFSFDTDFLTPALLPPLTPVFRDIDDLGFTMEIRPGK